MDPDEYQRILDLFRPTEMLQRSYGFAPYVTAMDSWLQTHTLTHEQLIRYMLMGLFQLYRAANHLGSDIQTLPERWDLEHDPDNYYKQQVVMFNKHFGRPITDTFDYLSLITGTTHKDFEWFPHGYFAFVIVGYGKPFDPQEDASERR